ncbi:hypothetical protein RD792_015789, partial [Penstemon davidsonii]
MENRVPLILLFTLLLPCFTAHTSAKKQIEALSQIYREKLKNNIDIDRTHFNANLNFHRAEINSQDGLKEKDRIEILPGQPPVKFKQYGGYVTVNQTAGRAFYYYFTEAQNSEKSLPLLLWLNGAANVLFVESPAGVGFSYSNTTADFVTGGDRRTAIDNYAFILNWLNRFPEYKDRDFYISGESYAGHYVPQLAHTILAHNQEANKTIINLKGIIIGNAVINDETDVQGMYEYFASHAIISDETWEQIAKYCDFSPNATTQTDLCSNAAKEVDRNTNDIDIYNIYAPMCHNASLTDKPKKSSALNLDPCGDNYVYAYLNRPEVQHALHANVTNLPYDWQPCSDVIKKWQDSPSTVLPLLKEFMSNGLRVWVF